MKYLIIIIMIYSSTFAQSISELVTDRPDQTESSVTVPKGWLQIETGALRESDSPIHIVQVTNTVFNMTLLRYGLLKKTELRFGGEFIHTNVDINGNESFVSYVGKSETQIPFVIGFKTQITEENV